MPYRLRRRAARTKEMVSRVTGKLTIYDLSSQMYSLEHFTADMAEVKTSIQNELDARAVDAVVEGCRQIKGTAYDYLFADVWVPIGSPILGAITLSAVIAAVKFVLPWVWKFVLVAVAIWVIDILRPKPQYYCDIDGQAFWTLAELTAHRRTAHPEIPPYECPYCGSAFNTPEELMAHIKECPLAPKPDMWENIKWILILAVGGILAITIVPKVAEVLIPKKK